MDSSILNENKKDIIIDELYSVAMDTYETSSRSTFGGKMTGETHSGFLVALNSLYIKHTHTHTSTIEYYCLLYNSLCADG